MLCSPCVQINMSSSQARLRNVWKVTVQIKTDCAGTTTEKHDAMIRKNFIIKINHITLFQISSSVVWTSWWVHMTCISLWTSLTSFRRSFIAILNEIECHTAHSFLRIRSDVVNVHYTLFKIPFSISMMIHLLPLYLRIFGCLARWECVKVKEAYDRGGYKRTLEVAIKTTLKGDARTP